MASSARILCVLALLAAANRVQGSQGGIVEGLGSADAALRQAARRRARAEWTVDSIPAILAAVRQGTERFREDVVEVLLDREDLGLAALRRRQEADTPLVAAMVEGAFFRRVPGAFEGSAFGGGALERSLDTSAPPKAWTCTSPSMDADALAAELRAARVLPYPVLVDPGAPVTEIALGVGVAAREELAIVPWSLAGLPLVAVGSQRMDDRNGPELLVVGVSSLASMPPSEVASALVKLWDRAQDRRALRRTAAAALVLGLRPFDRYVVEALAIRSGASKEERERARAVLEAILDAPVEGASALAAAPASLDAFLDALTEPAAPARGLLWRVLTTLPPFDARGRDVEGELDRRARAASGSARPLLLAVLAARRARAAQGLFEQVVKEESGDALVPALEGLRGLGVRPPEDALLSAFDRATTDRARERIAFELAGRSADPAQLLSRFEQSSGAARGCLLAVLLAAPEPTCADRALSALLAVRDRDVLSAARAVLGRLATMGPAMGVRSRLELAARGGSIAALLLLESLGGIEQGKGDAYAEQLLTTGDPALRDLVLDAAGRVASMEWVLTRVPALRSSGNAASARDAVRLLASHWRHSSGEQRSILAWRLTAGDNAPFELWTRPRERRVFSLVELGAAFEAAGQYDLVTFALPQTDSGTLSTRAVPRLPAIDRGPPFPDRHPLLDRLVP